MHRPEPGGSVPAHSAHALRVSAARPSPLHAVCLHDLQLGEEETCCPCYLLDNVDNTDLVLCTIRVVRQDNLCPTHIGLGAYC